MIKQVTIRLTGEEKAVKQAIYDLEQVLNHRVHLPIPRPTQHEEWTSYGTIEVEAHHTESSGTGGIPLVSDEPVFEHNERVRIRSTGNWGVVVQITPAAFPMNRTGTREWRYVVQFADGAQRGYVAEALESPQIGK